MSQESKHKIECQDDRRANCHWSKLPFFSSFATGHYVGGASEYTAGSMLIWLSFSSVRFSSLLTFISMRNAHAQIIQNAE
jgi:hypothetical protein